MNEIETLKEIIQNEKDLMYAAGSLEGADVRSGNKICLRNIAALELALEALREKQERDTEAKRSRTEQKPQPLTIEELQEFIDSDEEDNAIWVQDMKYDHFTRALLDWDVDRGIFAVWHGDENASDFPIEKDYGKTWLAYRTKPTGGGVKGLDTTLDYVGFIEKFDSLKLEKGEKTSEY